MDKTDFGEETKKEKSRWVKNVSLPNIALTVCPANFLGGYPLQSRVDENCRSSKLWEAHEPSRPLSEDWTAMTTLTCAQVISKYSELKDWKNSSLWQDTDGKL